jgi:hypothetical protein
MWKQAQNPQTGPTSITVPTEPKIKYFKIQMKGWTNFDPIGQSLADIAEAINRGNGFLTVVEVLEAHDDLASVSDEEVREGFSNIMAVKRLLRAVDDLPKLLKDELRAALEKDKQTSADETNLVPKKTAASTAEDERWLKQRP